MTCTADTPNHSRRHLLAGMAAPGAATVPIAAEGGSLVMDDDSPDVDTAERQIRRMVARYREDVAVDPHIAWSARAASISELLNAGDLSEAAFDVLAAEVERLHGLIAGTPARTPAGIAEQLRLALECHEGGSTLGECETAALRNAMASLRDRPAPTAQPAAHPDAELLAAWAAYRTARCAGEDLDEDSREGQARIAEMDRQAAIIGSLRARTPAGVAVKVRWALSLIPETAAAEQHMLGLGPLTEDLGGDYRLATLYGALQDLERLAAA